MSQLLVKSICHWRSVKKVHLTTGTAVQWVLAVVLILVASGLAAAQSGSISGTVTDGALALSGVEVRATAVSSILVAAWATTNAAGEYTLTSLDAGSYYVYTYNTSGYVDQLYTGVECVGGMCYPYADGTIVVVEANNQTQGIDFQLPSGGAIAGTVRNTALTPLVGVQVQIYDAAAEQVGVAVTAPGGTYLSPGLPTGTYYAKTKHSYYASELWQETSYTCFLVTAGTPISVTAPSVTTGIDFTLGIGGTLSGKIIDEEDLAPIEGVTVYIRDYWNPGEPIRPVTNSSGTYTVTGLGAGAYQVFTCCGSDEYLYELHDDVPWVWWPSAGGSGTEVPVFENIVSTVDFTLGRGGTVNGAVTEEGTGTPLEDAKVWFFEGLGWGSVTTGVDGAYSLTKIPPGDWKLRADESGVQVGPKGHLEEYWDGGDGTAASLEGVLVTVPNVMSGAVNGMDFALSLGGQISGTVTDTLSAPLEGITVEIFDSNGNKICAGRTNASGSYVAGNNLTPGSYYARTTNTDGFINVCYGNTPCLWLERDRYLIGQRGSTINLTSPGPLTGVDFVLTPGGRIAGKITHEGTNQPLAGMIEIYDDEDHLVGDAPAESDGYYLSRVGLPTGTYFVVGSCGYHLPEIYDIGVDLGCSRISTPTGGTPCAASSGTPVSVALGSTTSSINFALTSGGAIGGRVLDSSLPDTPVRGSLIAVYDSSLSWAGDAFVSFQGSYRTGFLPPGDYFLRSHVLSSRHVDVTYGSGVPCGHECVPTTATPVTVTASTVTPDVDLYLDQGSLIRGTVTDGETGLPYSGMEVYVYDAAGELVSESAASTRDGAYWTLSGLPLGTYFVRTNSRSTYGNVLYDGIACYAGCEATTGTPVVVSSAADDVSGIDFVLYDVVLFSDGFESGTTSMWSNTSP